MKALIIVCSYHHKKTEKAARRMASALDASVMAPRRLQQGQA
jgi:hypothetical protein